MLRPADSVVDRVAAKVASQERVAKAAEAGDVHFADGKVVIKFEQRRNDDLRETFVGSGRASEFAVVDLRPTEELRAKFGDGRLTAFEEGSVARFEGRDELQVRGVGLRRVVFSGKINFFRL